MDSNDLVVYGILGLVLVAGAFLVLTPQPAPAVQEIAPGYMALAQKAGAGEIPDKCKVPPGQDPVKWKEHLGHHPDQYAECL